MAQTGLDIKAASLYATLVTMTYGNPSTPTIRRYTSWNSDLVLADGTFTAEPTIETELGQQHGGTEDKPHKLTMSIKRDPLVNLSLGFAHAPVDVFIEQINPTDVTTRCWMGDGRITTLTKNPSGRQGLGRMTIGTIKLPIKDAHVGVQLNTTCDNRFNAKPGNPTYCEADAAAWVRPGTVASVMSPDANIITLTLPGVVTPATQLINTRYRRGFIEIDGLRLAIKRSQANGSFELYKIPGPYLVGKSCILYPGCAKTLEDCRMWLMEHRFNGRGRLIPKRNPVFENPNA